MVEFESERLQIRELEADDLTRTLPIYLTNQEYLHSTEGSGGEIGAYDLERWQRDWQIAQYMPGRHVLGCFLKESNEAVGILDYLEENEDDGMPWLGLIIIHAAFQRQQFGSEALSQLLEYLRQNTALSLLRATVLKHDSRANAFLQQMGFQAIRTVPKQLPSGVEELVLYERKVRSS